MNEIPKNSNDDCICIDKIYYITVIIFLILGGFLTLATRFLQNNPYFWYHSATVSLAFAISFTFLFLLHACCLVISRPNCKRVKRVLKTQCEGWGFLLLFIIVLLGIGTFFNWIWFKLDFSMDSESEKNGNAEARKYASLAGIGLGIFYLGFFICLGAFYPCYNRCRSSYRIAKSEEIITLADIQSVTHLPRPLSSVCFEYILIPRDVVINILPRQ
jgi:hypothetical protein